MTEPEKEKTPQERIAMGECVSPMTVDRCQYCVDTCDAAHWRNGVREILEENKINHPQ